MSLQLSKNATCVLTDADIYSRTQNAKMALNLCSNLPGSNIEGDKMMVITSANEPIMKPYSAGGEGGKIYGGVDGVVVDNDNDTIGLNDEVWNVLDSYTETSANFLTSADIADFATESYVTNEIAEATQDFITSADVPEPPVIGFENNGVLDTDYDGIKITNDSVGNEHVNLKKGDSWYNHGLLVPTSPGNDKYLTTTSAGHLSWENQPEIPSLDGYATEQWVQDQGYISSVPSEYVTDTEMSTYVAHETSAFVTSADIPEVPEVKDLVAGNGIDITTTSADVTIAAKVDGSTIKFDGSGNLYTDIAGVPTTSGASSGDVLTYNGSSVGWVAPQGGGGGGGMLPPIADNTVRCRFAAGYTPTMGTDGNVCVDAANNIWDITDNSDFDSKFYRNSNLLEVLGARITSVISRSCWRMFAECANLTKAVGLYISTENLTYQPISGSYMFSKCSALRNVEFTVFDVSDASYMFNECYKLEEHLGLNSEFLSNASYMFKDCYLLRVGYMGYMNSVTTMERMYNNCRSLTQIPWELPIGSYADPNCLNRTFEGCRLLESLPTIVNAEYALNSMNLVYTFAYCSNAVNGVKKAYDALSSIQNIGSTTSCFEGCGVNSYGGQQERAQIPAAWGGDGA